MRRLSFVCKGGTPADLLDIIHEADEINIQNMQIRQIHPTDVENFAHSVAKLTFSDCKLNAISDSAFEKMRSLEELVLSGNKLKQVKAPWFRNTVALKRLTISNSWIESIDEQAFDTLTKLSLIDLSRNNLRTIKASWFQKTVSIRSLNFKNNDISSIEEGAFSTLTSLTSLYLDANKLKSVEAGWFGKVAASMTISLDSNLISRIDQNAFGSFVQISSLKLSRNQLREVKDEWFSHNSKFIIEKLQVQGNGIHDIDDQLISRLGKALEFLDVSGNKLQCSKLKQIVKHLNPYSIMIVGNPDQCLCSGLKKLAKKQDISLR